MTFGEGGFRPKSSRELEGQLKSAQETIGKKAEHTLVPPSVERKDILAMPAEEIKEKYARRYEMYLRLLREKRHQEAGGETMLSEEEILEMRKWLSALNSLDGYITSHKEGRDVTLRERQLTVFEDLRNFVEAGGQEGYVKLPTGVGKTVLFTEFIEAVDLKTLVVVPTNVLVRQTEGKMAEFALDLDVGKVSGQAKQFGRQVTIITYNSFIQQIESEQIKPEDFDCLILDEVHLSLSKRRMEMVKKFEKVLKIGFTATPQYSAKKKVSNLLETEIHQMSIREAIEEDNLLCPVSSMLVKTEVDLSKVTTAYHGDYNEGDLARAVNVAGRNKAAVDLYKEMFSGKTTVTYCVGIEHAHAVARLFNENAVAAAAISGKTPPGEQEKILERFHNGEIKVLCNADLLTVGFDEPRASVCLNLRPTRSKVLAEQRGGRVLRLDGDIPDKEAFVIDFIDQGLDDKHLPVLFADVADGARFRRRSGHGIGGGGDGPGTYRIPVIRIPGIEVITDVTEIMRIVGESRVGRNGTGSRRVEEAVKELEEAFGDWQALPENKRESFNTTWLIRNGYNGLYNWAYKNTPIDDLVARSKNAELVKHFVKLERVSRTDATAVQELEDAFVEWQKQPKNKRGKFNSAWLISNGFKALYVWSLSNISTNKLIAKSQSAELRKNFVKREKVTRSEDMALQELETAFVEWWALSERERGNFSIQWLVNNGYNGLYIWSRKKVSIDALVIKSKNSDLKKHFVRELVLGRDDASALRELEVAFEKWKKLSADGKGSFNTWWLTKNGYGGLCQWSLQNIHINDLVAKSKNVELKENFVRAEKVITRTDASALRELESAFSEWRRQPKKQMGGFHAFWLTKNGYGGLAAWSSRHTSLMDLALKSKNADLRKQFVKF